MVFLNRNPALADAARADLRAELEKEGLTRRGLAGCALSILMPAASESRKTLPHIEQVFVNAPPDCCQKRFERICSWPAAAPTLRIAVRDPVYYVLSLSRAGDQSYKGLVMPAHLPVFYPI
jgi:glutamate synthase (NADPH/NADH) large chain